MSPRPVRVYRIDATWPDGRPRKTLRRHYLTRSGAEHHADVLRDAGAIVTVHPSRPVAWDPPPEPSAFASLTETRST